MNKSGYHYLTKTPGGKPPKKFLTLGVAMRDLPTGPHGSGPVVRQCVEWSLNEWITVDGEYSLSDEYFGQTPHELHRILRKQVRFKGQLDLWCLHAMDCMLSLAFCQYIEDGQWQTFRDKWTGVAILSDPPVCLSLKPNNGNGVLRVLGLENLGIWTAEDLAKTVDGEEWFASDWQDVVSDSKQYASCVARFTGVYVLRWFDGIQSHNLGAIRTTIAGQARTAFRHRFLRFPLLCHRNANATRLEEEAIFQGRTECFRLGMVNGPVYHLDFQSFYPSLLRDAEMPARLKHYYGHGEQSHENKDCEGWYILADVDIETDKPNYPCRNDEMQLFPIGRFRTALCGDELQGCISDGHFAGIHCVSLYEPEVIFREWVDWCLHLRATAKAKGDRVAELVAKLLTNSLWGSFAKRRRLWETVREIQPVQPWGEWFERELVGGPLEHYRSIGWLGQRLVDYGFDDDALPAITAAINSVGRYAMLGVIETAGRHNCYYVSTDSILCNETGMLNLAMVDAIADGTPGKLKVVECHEWVNIKGIHAIETQFGGTFAGIPDLAERDEYGNAEWSTVEKISGALKRGETPTAKIVCHRRGVTGNYRHGEVMKDGRIKPIRLEKW